jgi:hypothetical protein
MPDTTLSLALKEAYASATPDIIYYTLEFRHSLLPSPIRVVHDHNDLVATLELTAPENPGEEVTFIKYAFDIRKPEVSSSGVPTVEVSIDNVSRQIVAAIEYVMGSSDVIHATFREYLASDLSGPANDPPLHLDVLSISVNVYRVSMTLGLVNLMNKQFPTLAYESETFPSLAQ